MELLYLLLGGNLGDKEKIFFETFHHIQDTLGKVVKQSSIYETEPWGFESDDLFWNQAMVVETNLGVEECLFAIHRVEEKIGRIREEKQYSSRVIDIDILFYGEHIVSSRDLEVPHPRMCGRKFVLVPLAEIAPDKIHPVFQKSTLDLLNECEDRLSVVKLDV